MACSCWGVLLSDTNFGISEKKIDLRKTVLACDGSVSLGFHIYPEIPLQELVLAQNSKLQDKPQRDVTLFEHPKGLELTDTPITPTDIATAVNDMFHLYGRVAHCRGHGRLPVYCPGYGIYRTGGAGLLRHHGLWCAVRSGRSGRNGPQAAHPGGRRRISDDGY